MEIEVHGWLIHVLHNRILSFIGQRPMNVMVSVEILEVLRCYLALNMDLAYLSFVI